MSIINFFSSYLATTTISIFVFLSIISQTSLDSEKTNKYRILFGVSDGIYLLTSIMDVIVDDVSILNTLFVCRLNV